MLTELSGQLSLLQFFLFTVLDVRISPALTFEEMSANSKRYLEASGEWELVDLLGESSILKFGIDEWDIITFRVRKITFTYVNRSNIYLQ